MAVLHLTLSDVLIATPRSRLLRVDLGGRPFPFDAGQAVMVAPHGAPERRPFSLASSPSEVVSSGHLELLVGADVGSELEWAVPRALVDLEGPMGAFTFASAPRQPHVLFVAGGVGIAPLRSMLQEALRTIPSPRITLLYSARRRDEFAFIDEFRVHAREGRLVLHQTVTRDGESDWQGWTGRVGRDEFGAVLTDPLSTTCFVCGPSALVQSTIDTLTSLGVPDDFVRTEQWGG